MKFFYQILTTPTADTPGTTILLSFPDKRYFFGQISEGTQRACTERGVRISHLTDVFLTGQTRWANNGGLIGIILTQADALASSSSALEEKAREKGVRHNASGNLDQPGPVHGAPYTMRDGQKVLQRGSLTIHGARNLAHTVATARRFVFRQGVPVFTREYGSENVSSAEMGEDPFVQPTWSDGNIKVWAMSVNPSSSRESNGSSSVLGSQTQSPKKRSHDEFEEPGETAVGGRYASVDQRSDNDQLVRQSVVSDMFNSTWRMDSLFETRLAEVKMPAAIFVRNPVTKDLEKYNGPVPGGEKPLPDIKVLVRKPWPAVAVEKLPPTTRSDEAISYVVRNHDFRGKFDPTKAQELKVRRGADYGRLASGQNVESEDGKTVTPDMVLGQPRLGKGMAIIELPTSEYVENLVNRPEWKSPSVTTELEAFIWILGSGVGEHPKLLEFVANMSHCKHVVSSTDYCPNYLSLNSVAESAIRLARLKGDSYSVPVHDNVTLPQPGTATTGSKVTINKETADRISAPLESAEPGFIFDMEPKFGFNRTEIVPRVNPATTMQRIPRAVEQRMSAVRRRVAKPEFQEKLAELQKGIPCGDTEIVTLGTGSSSPSKYRNVSATLVHVPGYGYYLLDCGENTLGQLKRVYEPEKLREVLQNLRMIWISHLHADHHLGTVSLIKAWYEANYGPVTASSTCTGSVEYDMAKIFGEKRLFLVSDDMMVAWLLEYASVEDYGFSKLVPLSAYPRIDGTGILRTNLRYRHVRDDGTYPGHESWQSSPTSTNLRFDDESSPLTPLLRSATGLSDILTARVQHCRGALAVSLVFPNGFKLSYSGDCRPSLDFVTIGKGSTLLIHEATFQDDMQGSAVAKKHSTTAEALEVGRAMKARTILLTHFSQRYQKVASIDQRMGTVKHEENLTPGDNSGSGVQPDIPDFDEGEENDDNHNITSERPHHPARGELVLPRRSANTATPPVTVAFDYMRLRVRDIPIAQAYAPALEKLFSILEAASNQEADKRRLERLEEENKRIDNKKAKSRQNDKKQGTAAADSNSGAADSAEPKLKRTASVWSASESESGWSD